jgi:hypothetical protein
MQLVGLMRVQVQVQQVQMQVQVQVWTLALALAWVLLGWCGAVRCGFAGCGLDSQDSVSYQKRCKAEQSRDWAGLGWTGLVRQPGEIRGDERAAGRSS